MAASMPSWRRRRWATTANPTRREGRRAAGHGGRGQRDGGGGALLVVAPCLERGRARARRSAGNERRPLSGPVDQDRQPSSSVIARGRQERELVVRGRGILDEPHDRRSPPSRARGHRAGRAMVRADVVGQRHLTCAAPGSGRPAGAASERRAGRRGPGPGTRGSRSTPAPGRGAWPITSIVPNQSSAAAR